MSGASIIALPIVARMPLRSAAPKIASVWRTVPMSRIAVVPPSKSSAHASSADAASAGSSSAPSYGQITSRSQSHQLEIVGAAAREGLARVDVRLHEPRHHDTVAAIQDRVVARLRDVRAADLDDRAVARRDIAGQHAMVGIDRQDRAAAKDRLCHGSSLPENAAGRSSASIHSRRSPAALIATTLTGPVANSISTWRQPPHGELGGDAVV